MRRLLLVAILVGTAVGLTATPAFAKEDVEATLTMPVPLDGAPGEEITLAWTLSYENDKGKERPFNAQGVFVELFSAGDGESTIGSTSDSAHPTGEYEALVLVPDGGIGGIQIALMGLANGEPAPAVFPITNNPLPEVTAPEVFATPSAPSEAAATPPPATPALAAETSRTVSPLWIALLALALVGAVTALVLFLRRRRHPAAAA